MTTIEKTIEELVSNKKKLEQISYGLYGIKNYDKLEENQKEEVKRIFDLWKIEKEEVEIKDSIKDAIDDVLKMAKIQEENGGLLGIPTGLDFEYGGYSMDETISGYIAGKVYTIAGYSNVGKSNITYYMLSKIMEGKEVIFFSTEVNKGMVLQNLVKSKYKISFYEALEFIKNNPEKIKEDFKNITIYDDVIEFELIKKIVENKKPDIVVLDFVQGLTSQGKTGYELNSYLARAIQRLAIDNNTIVFSVAQITAGATREAKQNGVFTVKGAGEYFESSDVIFHIFRPVKDEPNDLILRIEKNKFGPLREFEIEAEFKTGQFKNT